MDDLSTYSHRYEFKRKIKMDINTLRNSHNWNLPEVCPVCGEPLILSQNHRQLTCSNQYCPSRSSGTIAKWVEKMKVLELGLTTIEKIQEFGYFMSIGSIYEQIDDPEVNKVLEGEFGKNWSNIKAQLKAHTEATLAQFISGYNISGVGEKLIQRVVESFGFTKPEDFVKGTFVDLICEGIGDVTAEKLYEGVKANLDDMNKTLKTIKLTVPVVSNTSGMVSGLSFCFTGAMEYKRSVLQEYVTREGGINFDSVKKGLSYLVMADPNSTSSKAVKARSLGIKLITPDEFLEMVGEY